MTEALQRKHELCLDPGTLGFHLPFRAFAAAAAQAGFKAIEAPVMATLAFQSPDRFCNFLSETGLQVPIFSCPWDLPANASVPEPDWRTRMAAIPHIFEFLEKCGASKVSVFFNSARPGMVALNRRGLEERLCELSRIARQHRLTICVELNDCDHLSGAGNIVRHIRARGHDVQLLVDVFHLHRCSLDAVWIEGLPVNSVGWVHLSDAPHSSSDPTIDAGVRCAPGTGLIPLKSKLHALERTGYCGPYSLEVLSPTSTELLPVQFARQLRRVTIDFLNKINCDWIDL